MPRRRRSWPRRWRDALACATGRHHWGGWSMTSGGTTTGERWCVRCGVTGVTDPEKFL